MKFLIILALLLMGAGCGDKPLGAAEDTVLNAINSAQTDYFKTHGRYFQGLPTSKTIPSADATPDNLSAKPTYQTEKWSDFVTLPSKLPYQITIDQYLEPTGDRGYHITLVKNSNGKIYVREYDSHNQERTHGWAEVTPRTEAD